MKHGLLFYIILRTADYLKECNRVALCPPLLPSMQKGAAQKSQWNEIQKWGFWRL